MNYIRRKGSSTAADGRRAAQVFEAKWRESQGDGGEDVGDVSHEYGVSPSDVTATAEKVDEAEGKGHGAYHRALLSAGYRHVRSDEAGHHYVMKSDEGEHRVRVSRESTGGMQAKLRTKRGAVSYHDSVDSLNALLPRRATERKTAEAISGFWSRYLRD